MTLIRHNINGLPSNLNYFLNLAYIMTHVNMIQVEFNKINNYIYIIIIFKHLNNMIRFLNHKISHKMTMPHKLVWMDEKFM
jgi:hypothetical protein